MQKVVACEKVAAEKEWDVDYRVFYPLAWAKEAEVGENWVGFCDWLFFLFVWHFLFFTDYFDS